MRKKRVERLLVTPTKRQLKRHFLRVRVIALSAEHTAYVFNFNCSSSDNRPRPHSFHRMYIVYFRCRRCLFLLFSYSLPVAYGKGSQTLATLNFLDVNVWKPMALATICATDWHCHRRKCKQSVTVWRAVVSRCFDTFESHCETYRCTTTSTVFAHMCTSHCNSVQ